MDNCTVIGAAQCTGWIVGAGHGHAGCCDGMSEGRKLVRTLHLHSVPVNRGHGAQGATSRTCLIIPGPGHCVKYPPLSFLSFLLCECEAMDMQNIHNFFRTKQTDDMLTCDLSSVRVQWGDQWPWEQCHLPPPPGPGTTETTGTNGTNVQQYRCCTIFGERPFWSLLLERPTSGLTQNL